MAENVEARLDRGSNSYIFELESYFYTITYTKVHATQVVGDIGRYTEIGIV